MPTQVASRVSFEEFTDIVNRSVGRAMASKELRPILDEGKLYPWIFVGLIWRWERQLENIGEVGRPGGR